MKNWDEAKKIVQDCPAAKDFVDMLSTADNADHLRLFSAYVAGGGNFSLSIAVCCAEPEWAWHAVQNDPQYAHVNSPEKAEHENYHALAALLSAHSPPST